MEPSPSSSAAPKQPPPPSSPKLSAAALAKREARAARRREQQEQEQQEQEQQRETAHDQEEEGGGSLWENTYAFSSFSLRVREEFGGESCVGGTQWPGGVRVARYLDNPAIFPRGSLAGKTVMDLGSGCGLVAAVAAKHGARVCASDKGIVMDVLTDNLRANGVLVEAEEAAALRAGAAAAAAALGRRECYIPEGKVVAEELWWGPEAGHPLAPFDVCIAAACLYQPKTVPLLLQTLHRLSDDRSLVILAAIIGQNTLEHFLEVSRRHTVHGCV
jgi:predicted nicotinamide N-methyase